MADNIEPISHLEKVITGNVEPISHLEKVIALYGGTGGTGGSGSEIHTHSNKAVLDKITQNSLDDWNDGVRKIAFVGSDAEGTNGWYKVAEQTCGGFGDSNITFMVTSTFFNYNVGILQLQIRSDNSSISCKTLKWLTRIGFNVNDYVVVINGMKWTLYAYQPNPQYGRIAFEILSMSSIDSKDMTWTLNFKDNNTKETTAPVATVTSSDGLKANVTDLTSHTSDKDIHITTAERTKWNEVDNKVNKTDIIDNLTSTNTDKPLSANQGKILNDKKLNKADVNKFDDLINLDSVSLKEYILENCTEEKVYHLIARSTCTDIPKANSHFYVIVEKVGSFTHKVTAKCLNTNEEYTSTYRSDSSTWYGWDKIALGDYNLETYTDINQLGLTAPVTVGEIFSAMPNFSLLRFQVDNYSVTDAPAPNGILIIDKIRSAKFSIEFKISADGTVAQNSLYIGQLKGSDASGLIWQRLCTTSVADVNKTDITYNTGQSNYVASSLGETNFYSVTNGICQCSIYYQVKAVSQGPMIDIVTGLPKPKDSFYVAISQYTGNGAPCRGYLTLDGTFKVGGGANGGSYMYTFTYPVRES